jgi:hypothetical protein
MRKPVLAGALATLAVGVLATAAMATDGGPATYDEALAQARQQGKVLVIDFYTDW